MPEELTPETMQELSEEFDTLCTERWEMGAQEYGPLGFLENDMFTFMMEELVDVANYARAHYVKLRLLQMAKEMMEGEVSDGPGADSTD